MAQPTDINTFSVLSQNNDFNLCMCDNLCASIYGFMRWRAFEQSFFQRTGDIIKERSEISIGIPIYVWRIYCSPEAVRGARSAAYNIQIQSDSNTIYTLKQHLNVICYRFLVLCRVYRINNVFNLHSRERL